MLKVIIKICLSILLIFVLTAGGMMFFLTRGLESGSSVSIEDSINLSALSDGIYTGKHEDGRFSNELKVLVKDNKITEIELVKDVTFPKEEVTKQIISSVIEQQSLAVDAVAGATITSKAYLKAMENALKK
ncbi:MAG: FMN-binding protein [Bacillota bacterium]